MTMQALATPRFIRKTHLDPQKERQVNFRQIDNAILEAITSPEADEVTPLMSKVYLRLVNAPSCYFERDRVLRITEEWRDGKCIKASTVLSELLGVSRATANKALKWLHDAGIIGVFAGKNKVGYRIFLNRAASSIAPRIGSKILAFSPGTQASRPGMQNEPASNESFAFLDSSDKDLPGSAPDGAEQSRVVKTSPDPRPTPSPERAAEPDTPSPRPIVNVAELVYQLRSELEPSMQTAARQAAALEHERTREWFENRALPKAARVAQRETYNVLRSRGLISDTARGGRVGAAEVDGSSGTPAEARPLSPDEINERAQWCVTAWQMHGQAVDVTLSEMSAEVGGDLLPEDAPKVRAAAEAIINKDEFKQC